MTEYEFDQMLAEFTHLHGVDAILPSVERAAATFGWPIPEPYREDVILDLCVLFPPQLTRH